MHANRLYSICDLHKGTMSTIIEVLFVNTGASCLILDSFELPFNRLLLEVMAKHVSRTLDAA